jgi:UDP-GlcNAc:undecaprenyl-phosphate/decaprenyl-phosphate GlcNAc-1-phosphate transferase
VYQLFAALLAMGITVMLIPPLMQWAGRMGVLDLPGGRKAHANPIPRVGGIAMAVGIVVAMLFWGESSPQSRAYLLAVVVLLLFGIQDDRVALSPGWKLLGQVLAATIVMTMGQVHIGILRHVDICEVPAWISMPITVLFIVGVTNAINLSDGLDGLAGGTTLLCLSGLLLLALTGGSAYVVFACVVTMGAVLGFLRYNTHPARIFMGDAGSQLLGFSAAVLSLILTQDRNLPYSAALPLLLLGVPVIDTLTVMTERIRDGKSPFQADRTHVHHRLLALGFDHHEAVIVIYGVQSLLLVLAWQLRFASDAIISSIFMLVAVAIVAALNLARKYQWRWRQISVGETPQLSWLRRKRRWLREDGRLNRWVGYVVGVSMLGYGILSIANGLDAPADIRWLAGLSALVLIAGVLSHRGSSEAGWLERGALYVSALIAVMMDRPGAIAGDLKLTLDLVVFGTLVLAIGLRLYLSTDRRFRISPLDVLVLLVALALPNLPGSVLSSYPVGGIVAKVLLLMYGIENLSVTSVLQWRMFVGGMLLFLLAVVVP